MCIISKPARVSNTSIFVSLNATHAEQLTVYSNKVATQAGAVMILPVPNPQTIRFIDLSNFTTIFDELRAPFQQLSFSLSYSTNGARARGTLDVVRVGGYAATVVPSAGDFDRLSVSEFGSIARGLVDMLASKYPQFGFVVCKLAANATTRYHPIAYAHRPLGNSQLFAPTFHVHNNHANGNDAFVEERAPHWDHEIYALNATKIETVGIRGLTRDFVGDFALSDKMAALPFDFLSEQNTLYQYELRGISHNFDFMLRSTREPLAVVPEPRPPAQVPAACSLL